MRTAAVIQAAGKGSRFESDQYKLLSPIGGIPLILHTLEAVKQAGFDEIVAVIGSHAEQMREVLRDEPICIVENPDWEKGQSTSLSAGLRTVENTSDRSCLLLGDQPFIQSSTLIRLMEASDLHKEEIIVPHYRGKRGNPIIVPAFRYPLLLELTKGDTGGRELLKTAGYLSLEVDDPGILRDIDTVEDLKTEMQRRNITSGV